MIENLLWFAGGLVVGVLYHAVLQPYVASAWAWIKERVGVRRDAE